MWRIHDVLFRWDSIIWMSTMLSEDLYTRYRWIHIYWSFFRPPQMSRWFWESFFLFGIGKLHRIWRALNPNTNPLSTPNFRKTANGQNIINNRLYHSPTMGSWGFRPLDFWSYRDSTCNFWSIKLKVYLKLLSVYLKCYTQSQKVQTHMAKWHHFFSSWIMPSQEKVEAINELELPVSHLKVTYHNGYLKFIMFQNLIQACSLTT